MTLCSYLLKLISRTNVTFLKGEIFFYKKCSLEIDEKDAFAYF